MTQQWGNPGQRPNPGGQQWTQPGWNRPAQVWAPNPGYPTQPQYPQQHPGQYPSATPAQYRVPQAQFGQPAHGQPGGFPPPGYSPRPPRRNPVRGLLLGLVFVVGLGFFMLTLIQYLGGGDVESSGRQPDAVPTAVAPTTPAAPVPEPDYNPPPIPQPETYEEATEWLTSNRVYGQAVAVPTDCQVAEIDITRASVTQLSAHFNELTACLMRVWQGPLEAAGFQLPRPPVTVYTEPITTGCGSLNDVNAVYCAADQRIYYAQPLYRIFPADQQRARFVAEMILAHEFGHTIQARTGILISSMAWEQQSSTSEARVFSRRLEVQADCLSGMFTTAVAQSSGLSAREQANLQELAYNLGDDVLTGQAGYEGDHGSGRARERWFTAGQESAAIDSCNTYTVPASQVR